MSYCCNKRMSYCCNERMSYYCTWGFVKTLGQFNHLDGTQNDHWSCPVVPTMQSLPTGAPWKSFGGPLGPKGLSWILGPRDPLNSQDELGFSIQDKNNDTRMTSNGAQWHSITHKRTPNGFKWHSKSAQNKSTRKVFPGVFVSGPFLAPFGTQMALLGLLDCCWPFFE